MVTNLGTPESPTPSAVRNYLAEFLSDPYVVEIPQPLWWLILHGIVLRVRPQRTAKLYKKIWTSHGSPLLIETQAISTLLQQQLPEDYRVEMGMRYGEPSLVDALEKLKNTDKVIVLPLYPQYTRATTGSTIAQINKITKKWKNYPPIHMIGPYFEYPLYIAAIVESIKDYWRSHTKSEKLLLSFHGIPARSIEQGDPYFNQCKKTAELIVEKLNLLPNEWELVFQSRFGKAKWLQPYCVEKLETLAKQGTKSVDVVCPGFPVDCLETLEEISITNKEYFLAAGGETYHYIPALNSSPSQIKLFLDLINLSR